MSDLERLIEIARVLPPAKVHAPLTVAEQMSGYVSDEEFLQKINSAPPLDVDEETAAAKPADRGTVSDFSPPCGRAGPDADAGALGSRAESRDVFLRR